MGCSASPRFYPDDPVWADDDRALDASKMGEIEDTNGYDFLVNSFGETGERRDVRAMNVNSVDEVPDSSWFTNRIGRRGMTVEEVVNGPDQLSAHLTGRLGGLWREGIGRSAGLPHVRSRGPALPDRGGPAVEPRIGEQAPKSSGRRSITPSATTSSRSIWRTSIASALVISEKATIRDPLNGRRRRIKKYDLDSVFNQAARRKDGRYRVIVSRFAPGRPAGNFRYYGTRPDDPNDIVSHEHRRELRGARVFGAWLNHDDSRGINSLDMVETDERKSVGQALHVRFRIDSRQRDRLRAAASRRQRVPLRAKARMVDAGDVRPLRAPVDAHRLPGRAAVDRSARVRGVRPAVMEARVSELRRSTNMRPDDAFWAARIVSRFTNEMIRGVVEKAQYSDPRATDYMTQVLITRRDKVVATWLNQVCPVIDPSLAARRHFDVCQRRG